VHDAAQLLLEQDLIERARTCQTALKMRPSDIATSMRIKARRNASCDSFRRTLSPIERPTKAHTVPKADTKTASNVNKPN